MHDVRVALDFHHVGELHAAEFGDAADVVAAQVHEHDVLGAFLGVGQQLLGQRRSSASSLAPRPRPGQRADRHHAVLDPHQDLGRAADQAEVAERQIEQERARIHDPEDAVDVERLGRRLDLEPLAGHDLEDVARLDVLLAMADDRPRMLAGEVGRGAERDRPSVSISASARSGRRRGQAGDQLVDPGAGRLVGRLGRRRGRGGRWATTRTVLRMWSKMTMRS